MRHHLGVLRGVYLDEILAGRKTVESRLGKKGYPPHGFVEGDDLIWLKQVSGPVRAVARVESVRYFIDLTPAVLDRIRREWNHEIRASEAFWRAHRDAAAATLIRLGDVCPLKPFSIVKRNRRAWVVLAGPPVPGQPIRPAQAIPSCPI